MEDGGIRVSDALALRGNNGNSNGNGMDNFGGGAWQN